MFFCEQGTVLMHFFNVTVYVVIFVCLYSVDSMQKLIKSRTVVWVAAAQLYLDIKPYYLQVRECWGSAQFGIKRDPTGTKENKWRNMWITFCTDLLLFISILNAHFFVFKKKKKLNNFVFSWCAVNVLYYKQTVANKIIWPMCLAPSFFINTTFL